MLVEKNIQPLQDHCDSNLLPASNESTYDVLYPEYIKLQAPREEDMIVDKMKQFAKAACRSLRSTFGVQLI